MSVDPRHLSLIADYMTNCGKVKGMNRGKMEDSVSPFLKMSFETCVNFLTSASAFCSIDNNLTPTS